MARILVTPRSVTQRGHPALDRLKAAGHEVILGPPGRQPTEGELLALLPGCEGYLAGVEPVSHAVLAAASSTLRVISRNGTGTDTIDREAARALGITVRAAAGANARGVAELTLGLLLALARSVPASSHALHEGRWERTTGVELEGKTLGVVGFGAIGQRVAALAQALGMTVLAYDPFLDSFPATFASSVTRVPFEDLLARSVFLTLHCPPTESGTPLLDATALARLPQGAYIVNTARAELIDEDALLGALESKRLGGVALDVFREEPPMNNALVRHPRVIATPHLGGFTHESVDRAMEAAVSHLLEELASQRPKPPGAARS